jgi:hypothetical protein
MSYSRWRDDCIWYTYWAVSESNNKNKQLFDICTVAQFTYSQLKYKLKSCLRKVKRKAKYCNKKSIDELKKYINEFILDVEAEYKGK